MTSTPGKRISTDRPLTAHDVAERLDHAAMRLVRILADLRQSQGDLRADVRASRYLTNALGLLRAELDALGIQPDTTLTAAGQEERNDRNRGH